MISNVLKTIGICLTSLGSFNIQPETKAERNRALTSYEIVQNNNLINTQNNYWTTPQTQPGNPYPLAYSKSNLWRVSNNNGTLYYNQIEVAYASLEGSTQYYQTEYQNTPYTFAFWLIKIEYPNNTINSTTIDQQFNQYAYNTTNRSSTEVYINKYQIINPSNNIKSYWTDPQPLVTKYNKLSNAGLSTFNVGKALYTEILIENEYQYSKTTFYKQNEIEQEVEMSGDRHLLEPNNYNFATNTEGYYVVVLTYVNSSNKLYNTSTWTSLIDSQTNAYTWWSYNQTIITGNIEQEVIDVPGIMFEVLTMPFTFWSRAFNITLFPGTPYQLNVSGLLLSLLAIAIFVFLIRKFINR